MSANSPHIKSHRFMAQSLAAVAETVTTPQVVLMLKAMALAHDQAADSLQADDDELLKKMTGGAS